MQVNSLDRSDLDQIWTHIDQHLLHATLDLMDLPNTQSLRPRTHSIGHMQVKSLNILNDDADVWGLSRFSHFYDQCSCLEHLATDIRVIGQQARANSAQA